MESNRWKLVWLSVIVALLLPITSRGNDVTPDDLPTIELLIDAHKLIKKQEDLSLVQLTEISTTHKTWTEEAVEKYNKTRKTLNKRLSDVNDYLKLALMITNSTLKLKKLIENYADFTSITYSHALKKPYVMIYYAKANYQLSKEVKHLKEMALTFAVAETSILKATMKEKYVMLGRIETSIDKMNRIISHTDLVVRSILIRGLKIYHLQDLLDDDTTDLLADKIIALWYKEQKVKI